MREKGWKDLLSVCKFISEEKEEENMGAEKAKILEELRSIKKDCDYSIGKMMGLTIAAGLCGCTQKEINNSIRDNSL